MKGNLETAWLRSTAGERQDFIELYADNIRELLPRYNDHDDPETEELLVQGDDGDDEQLDPAELPCIVDPESTEIGDDDEDFHAATRGNGRRAWGKRMPAAPRSAAEIARMTQEFLAGGGKVTRAERGVSGLQPLPKRVAAWRKKVSSKGA